MLNDPDTAPVVYFVHCIDTEGPMREPIEATFDRLRASFGIDVEPHPETLAQFQRGEGISDEIRMAVIEMLSPSLLSYNENWATIDAMLDELLSCDFRRQVVDDFGGGWKYSWHCMDHTGYSTNPRYKDLGYGNIFSHYRAKLKYSGSDELDELNWHFHPVAFVPDPTKNSTSYVNSYERLYNILSRRIIDDAWFPSVNRPGFHAERHDAHMFLEQWIPFDYANQAYEEEEIQPDFKGGRWGDWRRAPFSWRGYNPSHDDYQRPGHCRRFILRCLNLGSRLRILKHIHYDQAFNEARETGARSFHSRTTTIEISVRMFVLRLKCFRKPVIVIQTLRLNFAVQKRQHGHCLRQTAFETAEEAARALLGYVTTTTLGRTQMLLSLSPYSRLQERQGNGDKPPLNLKGACTTKHSL